MSKSNFIPSYAIFQLVDFSLTQPWQPELIKIEKIKILFFSEKCRRVAMGPSQSLEFSHIKKGQKISTNIWWGGKMRKTRLERPTELVIRNTHLIKDVNFECCRQLFLILLSKVWNARIFGHLGTSIAVRWWRKLFCNKGRLKLTHKSA